MPPVPPFARVELPRVCVYMPPPPFQEPVSRDSDPRSCLRGESRKQTFQIHVSIVDGGIRDVRYLNGRGSDTIVFDREVDACIRSSLSTWRYPTQQGCNGQNAGWKDILLMEPLPQPLRFGFVE